MTPRAILFVLLALLPAGCVLYTPPGVDVPAGWTRRTWQAQADKQCSALLAAGVSMEWNEPMIVIRKDGFHKVKRVDVVKRQQATCVFRWDTNTCGCDVYDFANVSHDIDGAPGFSQEHIEFNACEALHERGDLR
jgi:hypothetical protein